MEQVCDEDFFTLPLGFPEETPIQVRVTPKWGQYAQGLLSHNSLTWEETTKAKVSEVWESVITKTKIEERFIFL